MTTKVGGNVADVVVTGKLQLTPRQDQEVVLINETSPDVNKSKNDDLRSEETPKDESEFRIIPIKIEQEDEKIPIAPENDVTMKSKVKDEEIFEEVEVISPNTCESKPVVDEVETIQFNTESENESEQAKLSTKDNSSGIDILYHIICIP